MVVAVSGGPDSVGLLHILVRISEQLNITLVVAYVNHGLRPAEGAGETEFVRRLAAGLGVAFESVEVDVAGHAAKHHLSIEDAGRMLRYGFLEKTARRYHAAKIALGHTADDQAEEILLRLIRGTGRKGLSGMLPVREGRYLRPLLSTTKTSLLAYLADRGLRFLEDQSNRQRTYLRNRVRLDLLPYLAREFNPNIRQTLLQTAAIFRDEEELLAGLTRQACAEIISGPPIGRDAEDLAAERELTPDADRQVPLPTLHLDLERFFAQPRAIQRRVLEAACWQMRCRPGFRQIVQLLALAESGRAGSRLHLGRGLRVRKFTGGLHFFYPAGINGGRGDLLPWDSKEYFEIRVSGPGAWRVEEADLIVAIDCLDEPPPDKGKRDQSNQFLDLAAISFPLTLRSPRPGDRFHPLGSTGSKKVSDFLIDLKIAREKRWQTPVLLSAGAIIALPGLRIDHGFRLTDLTTRVLRVRCGRLSGREGPKEI